MHRKFEWAPASERSFINFHLHDDDYYTNYTTLLSNLLRIAPWLSHRRPSSVSGRNIVRILEIITTEHCTTHTHALGNETQTNDLLLFFFFGALATTRVSENRTTRSDTARENENLATEPDARRRRAACVIARRQRAPRSLPLHAQPFSLGGGMGVESCNRMRVRLIRRGKHTHETHTHESAEVGGSCVRCGARESGKCRENSCAPACVERFAAPQSLWHNDQAYASMKIILQKELSGIETPDGEALCCWSLYIWESRSTILDFTQDVMKQAWIRM